MTSNGLGCVYCGYLAHADHNAAYNLELLGTAGVYGLPSYLSSKLEQGKRRKAFMLLCSVQMGIGTPPKREPLKFSQWGLIPLLHKSRGLPDEGIHKSIKAFCPLPFLVKVLDNHLTNLKSKIGC
jgi:hypothetical protein